MHNYRKRSINLNLLENIHINRKEILYIWLRGLSLSIIIISIFIYFLKLFFINITNDTFSIKNEPFDFSSTDNTNNTYSFYSSYINNNTLESNTNDSIFILNPKKYGHYIKAFNLTEYNINKRRNKEKDFLYNLFRLNKTGKESPILIDYTSSLPHYPLFIQDYQKCFIRGEIISLLYDINNLACIDISGINYTNFDFILRVSLLDKNSEVIKLYTLKEVKVKNYLEKNEGKKNIIFYENNNMKNNLRFCSNEFNNLANFCKNMPNNYLLVMEINWKEKNQYFCLRNISLIYNK